MKKILIIITFVIIILILFAIKYYNFKDELSKTKGINAQYESYFQKELYGTDVATIVNRAVNDNENNRIKKDSKGFYIDNNKDSIKVDVKITDNNMVYSMESLYNGGMTNFVNFYNNVEFECTKIEYHEGTKKIKYILFEQKE